MLNSIIGLFKQIAGILGVPSIPFPLSLVPNCISIMPDIMKFVLNVPGQLTNAVYGTLKRAYGKIIDLQIPSAPDDINKPDGLPVCPKHSGESKDESSSGSPKTDEQDVINADKA